MSASQQVLQHPHFYSNRSALQILKNIFVLPELTRKIIGDIKTAGDLVSIFYAVTSKFIVCVYYDVFVSFKLANFKFYCSLLCFLHKTKAILIASRLG